MKEQSLCGAQIRLQEEPGTVRENCAPMVHGRSALWTGIGSRSTGTTDGADR